MSADTTPEKMKIRIDRSPTGAGDRCAVSKIHYNHFENIGKKV
jgi:hypothetical protein